MLKVIQCQLLCRRTARTCFARSFSSDMSDPSDLSQASNSSAPSSSVLLSHPQSSSLLPSVSASLSASDIRARVLLKVSQEVALSSTPLSASAPTKKSSAKRSKSSTKKRSNKSASSASRSSASASPPSLVSSDVLAQILAKTSLSTSSSNSSSEVASSSDSPAPFHIFAEDLLPSSIASSSSSAVSVDRPAPFHLFADDVSSSSVPASGSSSDSPAPFHLFAEDLVASSTALPQDSDHAFFHVSEVLPSAATAVTSSFPTSSLSWTEAVLTPPDVPSLPPLDASPSSVSSATNDLSSSTPTWTEAVLAPPELPLHSNSSTPAETMNSSPAPLSWSEAFLSHSNHSSPLSTSPTSVSWTEAVLAPPDLSSAFEMHIPKMKDMSAETPSVEPASAFVEMHDPKMEENMSNEQPLVGPASAFVEMHIPQEDAAPAESLSVGEDSASASASEETPTYPETVQEMSAESPSMGPASAFVEIPIHLKTAETMLSEPSAPAFVETQVSNTSIHSSDTSSVSTANASDVASSPSCPTTLAAASAVAVFTHSETPLSTHSATSSSSSSSSYASSMHSTSPLSTSRSFSTSAFSSLAAVAKGRAKKGHYSLPFEQSSPSSPSKTEEKEKTPRLRSVSPTALASSPAASGKLYSSSYRFSANPSLGIALSVLATKYTAQLLMTSARDFVASGMRDTLAQEIRALKISTQPLYPQSKFELSVAPMMAVTNRHFRYLVRLLSKRVVLYTEMINSDSILHRLDAMDEFLGHSPEEHPVVLQLGGSEPDSLAKAAAIGEAMGYDEINLNCGCPSAKVSKHCFGARLMLDPQLVKEICARVLATVRIPVTVKCRLGVDDVDSYEQLVHFISTVSGAGVNHFIIHARKCILNGLSTSQNRSVPPLRYEVVYQLAKDFPHLSFTINGGFSDPKQISFHHTLTSDFATPSSPASASSAPSSLKTPQDNNDLEHSEASLFSSPLSSTSSPSAPSSSPLSASSPLPPVSSLLRGVMVGRNAMDNPWQMADWDRCYYGVSNPSLSRREVLEKYIVYAEKTLEGKEGKMYAGTCQVLFKPILNLFCGEVGGKHFNRGLTLASQMKSTASFRSIVESSMVLLRPDILDERK